MTSMRTTRNSLTRSYTDSTIIFEKEFGISQKDGAENSNSSLKETDELIKNQDSSNDFSFEESSSKKRKKEKEPPKISGNVDIFCWRCHKSGDCISCSSCPRVYHLKCAQLESKPIGFWPCIECDAIKRAESTSRGFLTVDTLSELLSYAIERMKSYPGSEHFCTPVNTAVYTDYRDYVLKPMDISQLDLNVKSGLYSSTESFVSDAKWMVHNSYVYNSAQSYLTVIARGLLKVAKQECEEIDNCQYCYRHAHTFPPDIWFLEPCEKPHLLIWAKLSGFPFWPAKVMKITGLGIDVRFFGDHNRSIVPPSACLLFSRRRPQHSKACVSPKLEHAIQEVETHILKLEAKFQCCFVYANFRKEFDPRMINRYISQMLQKSDPENRERNFIGVKRKLPSIDLENIKVKKSTDITNYEKGCKNFMIISVPSQTSGSGSNDDFSTNKENKSRTSKTDSITLNNIEVIERDKTVQNKTLNTIEVTDKGSDKVVQNKALNSNEATNEKSDKIVHCNTLYNIEANKKESDKIVQSRTLNNIEATHKERDKFLQSNTLYNIEVNKKESDKIVQSKTSNNIEATHKERDRTYNKFEATDKGRCKLVQNKTLNNIEVTHKKSDKIVQCNTSYNIEGTQKERDKTFIKIEATDKGRCKLVQNKTLNNIEVTHKKSDKIVQCNTSYNIEGTQKERDKTFIKIEATDKGRGKIVHNKTLNNVKATHKKSDKIVQCNTLYNIEGTHKERDKTFNKIEATHKKSDKIAQCNTLCNIEGTHKESDKIVHQDTSVYPSPISSDKNKEPKIRIRTKEELNQIAINGSKSNLKETLFVDTPGKASSPLTSELVSNNAVVCNEGIKSKESNSFSVNLKEEICNNFNKILIPPKLLGTNQSNSDRNNGNIKECNQETQTKDLTLPNTTVGKGTSISAPNSSKYILIQTKQSPTSHTLPNAPVSNSLKSTKEITSNDMKSYNKNLSKNPCVSEGNNFKYFLIMKSPTQNLPTVPQKQNSPENKLKDSKSHFVNVSRKTCASNNLKSGLTQIKSNPSSFISSDSKHNSKSSKIKAKETISINKTFNNETSKSNSFRNINPTSNIHSSNDKRKVNTYSSSYTSDKSPKSAERSNALMEEIIIHNSNGEEISPQKFSQILRNPLNSKTLSSDKITTKCSGNEMPAKTNKLKRNTKPKPPWKTDFRKLVRNKNFPKALITSKYGSNKATVKSTLSEVPAKTKDGVKESSADIVYHQGLTRTNTKVFCSNTDIRNTPTQNKYPLKNGGEVLNQHFSPTVISKSESIKARVNSWSGGRAIINDYLEDSSIPSVKSFSDVVRSNFDLINPDKIISPSQTNKPLEKRHDQLVFSQNSNNKLVNKTNDNLKNNSNGSKGFVMSNSEVHSRSLDLLNKSLKTTIPSKTNDPREKSCDHLFSSQNITLSKRKDSSKNNSAVFVPTTMSQDLMSLNSKAINCNLEVKNKPVNIKSPSKSNDPLNKSLDLLNSNKINDNLKDNSAPLIVNHQEFVKPNCEINGKVDLLINKSVKMGTPSKSNDPLEKSHEQLVLNQNFCKAIMSKSESKASKTQNNLKDNSPLPVPTMINQEKLISDSNVVRSDVNLMKEPNNNVNITLETNSPLKQCTQLVCNKNLTNSSIAPENTQRNAELGDKELLHFKSNNLLHRNHSMKSLKRFIASKSNEQNMNLEKYKISPQKISYITSKENINSGKPVESKRFERMLQKGIVPEVCNQDVNPIFFKRPSSVNVTMTPVCENISQNSSHYNDDSLKNSFNKDIKTCTRVPNGTYPKLIIPTYKNLPCYFNESLENSLNLKQLYDTRYLTNEKLCIILGGKQYLRPTVVLEKIPDKEFNTLYEAYKNEISRQNFKIVLADEGSDIEEENDDRPLNEEISPEEILNVIGVKTIPESINYIEELQMCVSTEENLPKSCISEQAIIPSISGCDPVDSNTSICQQESNISAITLKEWSQRYPQIMKTSKDDVLIQSTIELGKVFDDLSAIKEKNEAVNVIKNSMSSFLSEFFGAAFRTLDNETSITKECINQKNEAVEIFDRGTKNYYSKIKKQRNIVKRKEWCSSCFNEAKYHCCFSASYCSYICQQKHWKEHFKKCRNDTKEDTVLNSSTGSSTDSNTVSVPDKAVQSKEPLQNQESLSSNSQSSMTEKKAENIRDQRQILFCVTSTNLRDYVKSFIPASEVNANKETISAVNSITENSGTSDDISNNLSSDLSLLNVNNNTNVSGNLNTESTNVSDLNTSISTLNVDKNSNVSGNLNTESTVSDINTAISTLNVDNNSNVSCNLNSESNNVTDLNITPISNLMLPVPYTSNVSLNSKEMSFQLNLPARNDSLILDQHNTPISYPKLIIIPSIAGQPHLKLNHLENKPGHSSFENITSSVSFIPMNLPSKNLIIKLVPITNQNVNNSERVNENSPINQT